MKIQDFIIIPEELKKTFDYALKKMPQFTAKVIKEEQHNGTGSWIVTLEVSSIHDVFKLGREFNKWIGTIER